MCGRGSVGAWVGACVLLCGYLFEKICYIIIFVRVTNVCSESLV